MQKNDYTIFSTSALLKMRGRCPGSEADLAIEKELAGRGEIGRLALDKQTRNRIPLLFTGAEWDATRRGRG
jgi:hypothetical protein